jgi:two-component system, LytTR family, sensor kinase
MLKLPRYTNKDLPIMLWTVIPFSFILNCIIFGTAYFLELRILFFATLVTFTVIAGSFLLYGNIAVAFRSRFPDEQNFFKRTMLVIFLFLIMSALLIFGLISIYHLFGFLDGDYQDRFTWAYLATGILNIFLTFLNEGISRFESWKNDLTETETLKVAYKQSQLMGLKSQVNPHFLFNSLNSLSGLIQEDTDKAEKFLDEMSRVYRYMLRNEEEQLVPLSTELQFIQSFFALLKARYNEGIDMKVNVSDNDKTKFLPPLSLQVIMENALYQNKIAKESPLVFRISSGSGDQLTISNNVQRKTLTEAMEYEAGLDNLVKKYQLMNQAAVDIIESDGERCIILPLIIKAGEGAT